MLPPPKIVSNRWASKREVMECLNLFNIYQCVSVDLFLIWHLVALSSCATTSNSKVILWCICTIHLERLVMSDRLPELRCLVSPVPIMSAHSPLDPATLNGVILNLHRAG